MRKITTFTAVLGSVVLLGAGCVASRDYYEPMDTGDYEYFEGAGVNGIANNLDLFNGNLEGAFGPRTGVNEDTTSIAGYDDGSFSDVQLLAETENGAVMGWMEIVGGVEHPELQPGFARTFAEDDFGFDSRDLFIRVVNCSGDQAYDWTYDQPADEVDVLVTEGPTPDTMTFHYTTRTLEIDPFTGVQATTPVESSGRFTIRR